MVIDPVLAVIVVVIVVVALGVGGTMYADRANKRDMFKVDTDRREERAHQERLEQEREARLAEARREEAEGMESARKSMALAQENIHKVQTAFRERHDQLIGDIHEQAKAGCDAVFQQRFGITRPQRAASPIDDVEVQDYLREHYAQLRDAALDKTIESLMEEEVERRIAAKQDALSAAEEELPETVADPEEGPEEEAPVDDGSTEAEADAESDAESEIETETEAEVESESEAETEAEVESEPEAEAAAEEAPSEETPESTPDEMSDEAADEATEEAPDEALSDEEREAIMADVREEFDLGSVRTYLLAAISARYEADGKPIGDLPWPAYTSFSPRGYGELILAEGAPVYAQDAYREFAWKKFHTGKRAEKPERGEYSWPASHGLGDGSPIETVPTPAGVFTVEGPKGALPLYEIIDCTWMRHSLEYQGALLEPDGQRSFFINLVGLRKGDTLTLSFDAPDFLAEAEDGPFFLNAIGEVNGAFVGLSASKPEAANLGEAPYELAERKPNGLVFRMTHDARRYDADTYPQFLEVHIAWCQPPSPRPEKIVRHVAN